MGQRIVHYESDSRLGDFLPGHLRAARDAGITIVSADWDSYDGSAIVVIEGIDRDNPVHSAVGDQAADYRRTALQPNQVPTEGLVSIDWR